MMQGEARHIRATLEHLSSQGADAGQIADAAVAVWHGIESALAPIVGQRGVAALYKRSLHLLQTEHSWLSAAAESPLPPGDFSALRAALALQTSVKAATTHDELLQRFRDLLSNLIGASLTDRLLRPVWGHPRSGDAAQDSAS